MTRQEEIRKAIDIQFPKGLGEITNEQALAAAGFELGVKWADNHPKSPWISVKDDLPYKHEKLTHSNYTDRVLVLSRHGFSEVAFMTKIGDTWEWNTPIVVIYWMPIPQLPKE